MIQSPALIWLPFQDIAMSLDAELSGGIYYAQKLFPAIFPS